MLDARIVSHINPLTMSGSAQVIGADAAQVAEQRVPSTEKGRLSRGEAVHSCKKPNARYDVTSSASVVSRRVGPIIPSLKGEQFSRFKGRGAPSC